MLNKVCTKCHIRKSVNDFVSDSTKKDKLYPSCKDCYRVRVGASKRPDWHGKIVLINGIYCRWCQGCKKYLDCDLFYTRKNSNSDSRCKDCVIISQKTEHYRETSKKFRIKERTEILKRYGGICQCCGEDRYEFLAIDHINGGGNEHRREIGKGHIYRWLKKNNYPKGFRVLCHNCNLSNGFYGYCPHNK